MLEFLSPTNDLAFKKIFGNVLKNKYCPKLDKKCIFIIP
jgi:hypothetical protein